MPIENYEKTKEQRLQTRNHRQNHRILHQKPNMKLKIKCPNCGYWNRIDADKLFIEQETSEPKVKAYIPMYKPQKVETCRKCKSVIAEPKELIRKVQGNPK